MKFITINRSKTTEKLVDVITDYSTDSLWMPEKIPIINISWWRDIVEYDIYKIAAKIITIYLKDFLSTSEIETIVKTVLSFKIPVKKVHDKLYILELFHGPTQAFKDVGARFMASIFSKILKNKLPIKIVVATSGDTGGAVANAFSKTTIPVIILFPKDGVSAYQKSQIACWGKNVTAIEINGSFDDCQAIVKYILKVQSSTTKFISANSINLMRLLPQIVYYVYAYSQLKKNNIDTCNWIVPSGNMGNVCAGIIAHKMGMPANRFIIATNSNDTIPRYLKTLDWLPNTTVKTISNAMDVSIPSNWCRIEWLFNNNIDDIKKLISSYSVTETETKETITDVYKTYGLIIDPHTAVGWAIEKNIKGINLLISTAHPFKFANVVEKCINKVVEPTSKMRDILGKKLSIVSMSNNKQKVYSYIIGL